MDDCDRDEFPAAYFLNEQMPEWTLGGEDARGQLVRYVPRRENQNAGRDMFRRACFNGPVAALSDRVLRDKMAGAPKHLTSYRTQTYAAVTIDQWPEFTITAWDHAAAANPPADDGLWDNACWPQARTPKDPGFALLGIDPWNRAHNPQGTDWNYSEPYVKGSNGD